MERLELWDHLVKRERWDLQGLLDILVVQEKRGIKGPKGGMAAQG